MFNRVKAANQKYFWIEVAFLLFLSYGISFISDLEYSAYEEHHIANFYKSVGYRFITGSFSLICYGIYYWGFCKRYVFKRQVVGIILCSIGFIVIEHLVDKFISNWVIIHTNLVSESVKKRALADLIRPRLIFAFNYPIISSVIPIIGLAFVIRSLTQEIQMKELREQQLLSELNYLKAQIQPHFFFNTINNIYSLALKQSKDTAPMVANLGEMMRYILYEASEKTVKLNREVDFLNNYVAIEKMRHKDNNCITLDLQGPLEDIEIKPLLLLPFIENAFKHGLEQETGKGFVNIVLYTGDNELILQVNNSKPVAMKKNVNNGIGLTNVIKRLDLLYPGMHILNIEDEALRHTVTLTLNFV